MHGRAAAVLKRVVCPQAAAPTHLAGHAHAGRGAQRPIKVGDHHIGTVLQGEQHTAGALSTVPFWFRAQVACCRQNVSTDGPPTPTWVYPG